MRYYFIKDEKIKKTCIDLVNFVISRQKEDGRWNYSLDLETNREREQIDFHQGFVLESISNIADRIQEKNESWGNSVRKGLEFYRNKQFFQNGRSVWRYPREFPIDIHNQSQGIITFSRLSSFDPGYLDFAGIIASWTIKMMQSQKGYFYYRLNKRFPNRIPYIRWSQAWMLLALTFLLSGSQQPVSK
jgi:rhamnogalacturonyl hydrolase YesR